MNTEATQPHIIEALLAHELLHTLPVVFAQQPQGLSWAARLDEAREIGGEVAIWSGCAQVARLFAAYPDQVKTVEIMLNEFEDRDGNPCVNGHLIVNGEEYSPGDTNEFDVELMEAMSEVDELEALNAVYDATCLAVPEAVIKEQGAICTALARTFENPGQAWGVAAEHAPRVHPIMEALRLELGTDPAAPTLPARGPRL